jgi:hypothetical protein
MENNFFMPIGKMVSIIDTNNILVTGKFQGFVTFGGIPSIFLSNDIEGDTKNEIIIPINQVVNFSVVKPKNILL